MYLPARGNQVLALEADTGKEVWRHLLPRGVTTTARGVAYWPGDGRTGAAHPAHRGPAARGARRRDRTAVRRLRHQRHRRDRRAVERRADHLQERRDPRRDDGRSGARPCPATRAPSTSAPARSCGTSTPCRCPGEVGHDTWLDHGWRDRSGVNVWAWYMTLDEERGILYMPVAGPAGNYWGGDRPGQQPVRQLDRRGRRGDRASTAGTSRPCITISGIRTCRRRRCSWTSCRTAGAFRRSRRSARPATCSSSIA